jgi:hypothetical protein
VCGGGGGDRLGARGPSGLANPLIAGSECVAALRISWGSTLLDFSAGFSGSREKKRTALDYQGITAVQCYRFLDSEVTYEERELNLVLRALQTNPLEERLRFFNDVREVRRRKQVPWEQTQIAKLFTTPDEFHLLQHRAVLSRIQRVNPFHRCSAPGKGQGPPVPLLDPTPHHHYRHRVHLANPSAGGDGDQMCWRRSNVLTAIKCADCDQMC